MVKKIPTNAGNIRDTGLIPGSGRFPGGGGGSGNPLQYSCLENPRRQRSLVGFSLWGHKESDTTEMTEHAYTHVCDQQPFPGYSHMQIGF